MISVTALLPAGPVSFQGWTVKDERDVDSLEVVGAEGNAGVIAGEHDQGMLEIWQSVAQLCEESLQARIDVMKGVELALAKRSWKTFRDGPGRVTGGGYQLGGEGAL